MPFQCYPDQRDHNDGEELPPEILLDRLDEEMRAALRWEQIAAYLLFLLVVILGLLALFPRELRP